MRVSKDIGSRLFRHDWQIALNTARTALATWHDRLIAVIMLLAALAVARAWLSGQSWTIAALAALSFGLIVGIGAGRLVARRLEFHSFDGLLAADALHHSTRRHYQVLWHAVGGGMLTALALIVQPSLLIFSVAAYLFGAMVALLTNRCQMPTIMGGARFGRTIRAWLIHPSAGIAAAVILLLSLLSVRTLDMNPQMAIIGIETVLIALTLTTVDNEIVRFMTIAGHGCRLIVLRHAKAMILFIAVTVPSCWLLFSPGAAEVVAAASSAILLLLVLRILAYRLYHKRFADIVVSILVGLLMLITYSMPVAFPFIAIAIFWQLQRRGAANTWLLA